MRYKVICLSSNDQEYDVMLDYAERISYNGSIAIGPFKDKYREERAKVMSDYQKQMYVNMQRQRIDMCDSFCVINTDNKISDKVRDEINYALLRGKEVDYIYRPEKPYIITLCGSLKFVGAFANVFEKFTLGGYVVHTPGIFMMTDTNTSRFTKEQHEVLDRVHSIKMLQSDEIFIIDPDGYIGADTKKEIEFAKANNLKINYLSKYNLDKKEDKEDA